MRGSAAGLVLTWRPEDEVIEACDAPLSTLPSTCTHAWALAQRRMPPLRSLRRPMRALSLTPLAPLPTPPCRPPGPPGPGGVQRHRALQPGPFWPGEGAVVAPARCTHRQTQVPTATTGPTITVACWSVCLVLFGRMLPHGVSPPLMLAGARLVLSLPPSIPLPPLPPRSSSTASSGRRWGALAWTPLCATSTCVFCGGGRGGEGRGLAEQVAAVSAAGSAGAVEERQAHAV